MAAAMEAEVRAELDVIGRLIAQRAMAPAEQRLDEVYHVLRSLQGEGHEGWVDNAMSVVLQRRALYAQVRHDSATAIAYLREAQGYAPNSASIALNTVTVLQSAPDAPRDTVLAAAKHAVQCLEGASDTTIPNRVNLLAQAYLYYSQAIEALLKAQHRKIEAGEGRAEDTASLENRVHSVTLTFANSADFARGATDETVRALIVDGCRGWSRWLTRARLPFPTYDAAAVVDGDVWGAQVAYAQYFDTLPEEGDEGAGHCDAPGHTEEAISAPEPEPPAVAYDDPAPSRSTSHTTSIPPEDYTCVTSTGGSGVYLPAQQTPAFASPYDDMSCTDVCAGAEICSADAGSRDVSTTASSVGYLPSQPPSQQHTETYGETRGPPAQTHMHEHPASPVDTEDGALDALAERDVVPTTRYRPIHDLLSTLRHGTPPRPFVPTNPRTATMPSPGYGYGYAEARPPPTEPAYSGYSASAYTPSYTPTTQQQTPTPHSAGYNRIGTPMGPVHVPIPFGSPATSNPSMVASPRNAQPFRGVDRVAVTMPQTTQDGAMSSQNHALLGQRLQGHRAMPSFVSHKDFQAEEAKRVEHAQRKEQQARRKETQRMRNERVPPSALSPRGGRHTPNHHRDPAADISDSEASEGSESEGGVPGIFQKLVDKAKLQEQKLEAMREAKIRKELAEMKDKPTITKKARQKTFQFTLAERAMMKMEQRKADVEAAAQAAAEAEAAELDALTFKPKITKRGQIARGKAHALAESDRARAARNRVKTKMHDEQLEELAECSFQPKINSRSERLAERAKARKGGMEPGQGGPDYTHADSLMDRSQAARVKTYAKHQAEAAKAQQHTPCISRYAAVMAETDPKMRDQNAFDRLYTTPRVPPQPAAAPFGPPLEDQVLGAKYSPARSSFV